MLMQNIRFRLFGTALGSSLLLALAWASIGWSGSSLAANDSSGESARVDQLFAAWDKPTSPGCALSVMKDGRIVYERGYGMADLDHDLKITPSSVFHVASMSKQFTAASILMLAQQGKISLDDPARKYVPELPDFGVPITLRHLLHHTSGLRDQWDLLTLAGWRYSLDLITDEDVLAVMSRQKDLNFQPGSKFLYSNTGFTLLAQVVKNVSGQSFRSFTSEHLFAPLGMSHTHFRDNHAEIVHDIAYGYVQHDGSFNLSIPNFDTVGATSLLTTVEDLAAWDENFYIARVGGPALISQMQERGHLNDGTELNYAAGLFIEKYRGLNIVEHAGADAGYKAELMRFPDQHFSVALLCNLANINPSALSRRVADIYLASVLASAPNEAAAPAKAPTMSPPPSPQSLEKWVGLYVDHEASDRVYHVRLEGGQLTAGLGATGAGEDIVAIDQDRFRFIKYPRTELFFQAGANDAPPEVTSSISGKKQYHYTRVGPYEPTAAQLQEFTGVYRSEEIDMPHQIVISDGRLVVRSLKSPDFPLRPVSTDLFEASDGDRLRFTRDAQGKVTGAMFNGSRVLNFRFERAS
jgi:CubicO group peptidase (beta-lactamase class C family)